MKRRGLLVPVIASGVALIILMLLGAWQLSRRAWKQQLSAAIEQRVAAPAMALPPRPDWPRMTRAHDEFRRVRMRAHPADARAVFVYTSGSALRADIKAPGYFVFAPARLEDGGTIVVNRGYVPLAREFPRDITDTDIVGYLRWPESGNWFIADHDAKGDNWLVRDPSAMAALRHWGEVAPFYVDQEAPVPIGGLPRPAPLSPNLRNDHLQYALTWFGLALVQLGVFAAWAISRYRGKVVI
ncbi:MAG: SURF1 family protein [Proteobacteria bacterium]|nr:SURF1 family protein [Pseudomonadota bacterium]